MRNKAVFFAGALLLAGAIQVRAWDYEVHRLVNQLALASLPTNFPSFVHAPRNAERIAFLSGEPDRWRNTSDLPLKHASNPDHFIDLEDLEPYGLTPADLPEFRYDFVGKLAVIRESRPGIMADVNPDSNKDHTKELVGLLPWAINENYSRLKSGFSSLRALERGGGTREEIENARQNLIYVMGVMGHFVGDASQPLHTTKHYNGWVGENPEGYTAARGIHALIDGGFFEKTGLPKVSELQGRLAPATGLLSNGRPARPEETFKVVVRFIQDQHRLVEPLYRLEKAGAFSADEDKAQEGREFLETQLIRGARMLADIWVSAWRDAPEDTYLLNKLAGRRASQLETE